MPANIGHAEDFSPLHLLPPYPSKHHLQLIPKKAMVGGTTLDLLLVTMTNQTLVTPGSWKRSRASVVSETSAYSSWPRLPKWVMLDPGVIAVQEWRALPRLLETHMWHVRCLTANMEKQTTCLKRPSFPAILGSIKGGSVHTCVLETV